MTLFLLAVPQLGAGAALAPPFVRLPLRVLRHTRPIGMCSHYLLCEKGAALGQKIGGVLMTAGELTSLEKTT